MAKILVVDDDEHIVKVIKDTLGNKGYEVVTANDGEEALKKFKSDNPDLLILDLKMPKLNGYEVAEQVRTPEIFEKKKHVPIIMLTARTTSIEETIGFASGADEYMKKPFDPGELLKLVERLI